jgi:hypothetical protein
MSNVRQKLLDMYPGCEDELVFLEPAHFDDAVIGVVQGNKDLFAVCYSEPKVLEILMEKENMDPEEAMEWYQFNIFGAYVGKNTPVFVDDEALYVD